MILGKPMRKQDSKDTTKGTLSSILDCGHLDFKPSEELCFGKWYYNSYIRDIAMPAHRRDKGGLNSQLKNDLRETATNHFHGWLKGGPRDPWSRATKVLSDGIQGTH